MRFFLDCDTGIDDAVALAYLLASPDVELVGIGTVNGNTTAEQAARNTLGLLALGGIADIPVAVGAGVARDGAAHVHGGNGVGEVTLPDGGPPDPRTAVELLIEMSHRHEGLHLLVTGPCTNVADALEADRTLPGRFSGVTVMGGAVRVPGNVTPEAEANIHDDPAAAAAVLAADWPVTLIPLDVTMNHRWTEADQADLRATGTPFHRALADMLTVYFDFYEPEIGVREVPLHDPLAAAVAAGTVTPGDAPVLGLRVTEGGATRADPSGPGRARVVFSTTQPAAPTLLHGIKRFPIA
jgi:purine nucleosidase